MKTTLPELESEEKIEHTPKTLRDYYILMCKSSSKYFNFLAKEDVKVTEELKEALKFLNTGLKPHEVIIFSRLMLIISFLFFAIINIIFSIVASPSIILITIGITIPFFIAYWITDYPKTEAKLERINALSKAPTTLTQLVIFLKQNPNLEKAIEFISNYSSGKIVEDFKKALWKCLMGHKVNLKKQILKIADKWGKYLSELKRSIYLIVASIAEKDEIKRNQTLDRAIAISLEGIVNKVKEYTNQLYLPTLFLFSFGTVLPLVIISLLPILAFLGKEFSSPLQMFALLIASLLGIYLYSNKILSKRPPSFASIEITNVKNPKPGHLMLKFGKKEFQVPMIPYLLLLFILIGFPGILFVLSKITYVPTSISNILKGFNTLSLIWAFGIVIVVHSYGTSWFKKEARDKVEEVEKEIVDGLYQLASRISEGRSPEETIKFIGESMPHTKFGEIMKKTYEILRSRHTTLEDAFFNEEYGSLIHEDSKNLKIVIRIFLNSLKKGVTNCAHTLFTISNHYDELHKTENKLKATLKNSLSMMRTTASIFAPIVTGLVITLQQLIQTGIESAKQKLTNIGYEYFSLSFLRTPRLSSELLQLIAGIYMILLAYLLIRYVSLIEYGKDEVMLKYEIWKNIPIALFIFTFTLIMSKLVLGV